MTIRDAVVVNSRNGYIGYNSGSAGTVAVNGAGSKWVNSENLIIGNDGSGAMNITNGGMVNNTSPYFTSYIGLNSGSTGTVTVDGSGSKWTNNGDLYVGCNGQGTLTISNKGLVSVAGTLSIYDNDEGSSSITMASGGKLAIYGDADGSISEFLGLVSGTDEIRYWDPTESAWTNISQATENKNYTLDYLTDGDLAGYTLLTFLGTPINGDANYDGVVDVGDLGILAANYGRTGERTWSLGDFNMDGVVDVGDLGILAANYGSSANLLTVNSVPEPMTLTLLALGSMFGIGCKRK
jgi:T5SS/PEP-CTERM-associated repeat protein